MTERMDMMVARQYKDRDGNAKTAWTKIGTAWATSAGWSLVFEALPTPSLNANGQVETRAVLMPARENDRQQAPRSGSRAVAPADDDIPFAPEWR